jgi:hypothetical protein
MKIWLLTAYTGTYEDYTEKVLKAFRLKDQAIEQEKFLEEKLRKNKGRLEVEDLNIYDGGFYVTEVELI